MIHKTFVTIRIQQPEQYDHNQQKHLLKCIKHKIFHFTGFKAYGQETGEMHTEHQDVLYHIHPLFLAIFIPSN